MVINFHSVSVPVLFNRQDLQKELYQIQVTDTNGTDKRFFTLMDCRLPSFFIHLTEESSRLYPSQTNESSTHLHKL